MSDRTMREIGPQYTPDDPFKAAARLHQSRYRAEVLGVGFDEFGNRLLEGDARGLLNYYEGLNCREVLRGRYPGYSKMRDADMLRSEHIPFNLLAPLDCDREVAVGVIERAFGISCEGIECVEMEYAPSPKERYLDDNTAFDTYIGVRTPDGKRCGIGIEVKYTEGAYRIGKTESVRVEDHGSPYWQTARAAGCFIDPDDPIFGTDPLRQVWRNHLLGLSMVEHGDIDQFYSITLFPTGNTHFHHVLPQYTALLKEDARGQVFGCTFETFIGAIGGTGTFDAWREWLWRRYVV